MRKGTPPDQSLVVNLMARMFAENPAVISLIAPGKNIVAGIQSLARFAFLKCLNRDGVWISDNEKAVALCYPFYSGKFSLLEFLLELRFALTYIGVIRLPAVLAREAFRKKQRPPDKKYLYFWFLASLPHAKEAAFELKNGIFKLAKEKGIPIYLETSLERNQKIYERFGFKTYHIWEDPKEKFKFWFLKKES